VFQGAAALNEAQELQLNGINRSSQTTCIKVLDLDANWLYRMPAKPGFP